MRSNCRWDCSLNEQHRNSCDLQIQFIANMQKELTELEENHIPSVRVLSPSKFHSSFSLEKELLPDSQLLIVETKEFLSGQELLSSERDANTELQFNDMLSAGFSDKQLRSEHEVILAGTLEKSSDSFLKPWTTCFCILTSKKLLCFADETRTKLVSCVNFGKVDCLIKTTDDTGLTFDLIYGEEDSKHSFRSSSLAVTEQWMGEVHQVIKSFINAPKIKLRKDSHEVYRLADTLLEEEFFQEAQSGDLLLMRTSDSKCGLQRLLTNSQYDHVSLVVKFPNSTLKVFEANADEGVQLYSWEDFNCKFPHFEKICYRKLYSSCKADLHSLLVSFMKQMIGKKYNFGAMKLLRNKSSDQDAEPYQTDYFCSELVAKAYKSIGLLDKSKGSNSFWPVDFTSRGGVIFEGDSYLGFEKLIIQKRHLRLLQ